MLANISVQPVPQINAQQDSIPRYRHSTSDAHINGKKNYISYKF